MAEVDGHHAQTQACGEKEMAEVNEQPVSPTIQVDAPPRVDTVTTAINSTSPPTPHVDFNEAKPDSDDNSGPLSKLKPKPDPQAPQARQNGLEGDKEGAGPKKPQRSFTQKLISALTTPDSQPAGGLDNTPVPSHATGYTLKITFHKCLNLPVADLSTGASDPFILASLTTPYLRMRHKEDPELRLRTRTVYKNTAPEWEQEWIVGGVPAEGARLKCRIYDEDTADSDDRLGNVTIAIPQLRFVKDAPGGGLPGFDHAVFEVKKRSGSWRAYALKAATSMCTGELTPHLEVSIEILGESEEKGRMYTLGPSTWTKHNSPMIGRLAGVRAPTSTSSQPGPQPSTPNGEKPRVERYDFQANQLQLCGPVPEKLYHRFVEFKPFVRGMFTASGLRGKILNKALHHQHTQIYSYSPSTRYGSLDPETESVTRKFLELCHAEEEGRELSDGRPGGGRLFTYVLTLDALLRFTETGKEFGVDLLSKHTMHSDVNVYVACSGEFFIRRIRPHWRDKLPEATADGEGPAPSSPLLTPPPQHENEGRRHSLRPWHRRKSSGHRSFLDVITRRKSHEQTSGSEDPGPDPGDFELVIDNDSGTYRPHVSTLPYLKDFLEKNLPGLKIRVENCADDRVQEEKKAQREIKKGHRMQVLQRHGSNSSGGWSSSDEERFERLELGDEGDEGGRRRGWKAKSKRERVVDAVEDPEAVVKGLMDRRREEKERKEHSKDHKAKDKDKGNQNGEAM